MHTYLIAQATQPATWLTAELITGLVALVTAIGAAVAAVIAAVKGSSASAKADMTQSSVDRLSHRATSQDERVSRIERDLPPTTSHQPPTVGRSPLLLLPLLALFFTGCAALISSAPESWVRADKATHDAIAPEYIEYVDKDDALDQAGKDRRHRTVQTWETRLEEHEKTLAKPGQ